MRSFHFSSLQHNVLQNVQLHKASKTRMSGRLHLERTEQQMHGLSDWLLWNKLFEPMQISKLWKRLPTRMLSLWEGDVQFGVWLPNNWYNNEHRGKSIQG
nr:uncharacterized protein LOC117692166 isoform X4 [Crassostrea gigas]